MDLTENATTSQKLPIASRGKRQTALQRTTYAVLERGARASPRIFGAPRPVDDLCYVAIRRTDTMTIEGNQGVAHLQTRRRPTLVAHRFVPRREERAEQRKAVAYAVKVGKAGHVECDSRGSDCDWGSLEGNRERTRITLEKHMLSPLGIDQKLLSALIALKTQVAWGTRSTRRLSSPPQ